MQTERLKRSLRLLTREARIDYLALYPARVLQDHGDMRLDLEPDDPRLPLLVRIPLRVFLPGAYVKVQPGSRVLLGFEGADPAKPVAYLWEAGGTVVVEVTTVAGRKVRLDDEAGKTRVYDPALLELEAPLVRLAGGGPAVARVGDQIQVSGVAPGTATVTGTIISGSSKTNSG
ncbi:MAG: hypothetical protein N2313_04595 [Meiothermus ruber]|uniref:hypothetical protein n=1 Tax=Meiothermus sp. TaxID=1955249 RepID=UPI0025E1EEDD|nr:hypothetical protein [Meiothermus sp.]MCS7069102.1 hypothetical protein [Meiothermus sp.]MCX7802283.1 hypothetical protein [Meiothermus ruber]